MLGFLEAAIGASVVNWRFVRHSRRPAGENAVHCTNGRNAKAAPQCQTDRRVAGKGRSHRCQ
jgi:hypothetical protein